jgi:hypothetical protein
VPGIAVPFFLGHPRLLRLERRMLGEAEGSSRRWRQRLFRHELGHAVDTAFGLRRRRDWQRVFGRAGAPYSRDYTVRPGSKDYVLHLEHWYAQSHPTEDFAETFAVWLQPKARWRAEYSGWPALAKSCTATVTPHHVGIGCRNTAGSFACGARPFLRCV